MSVTVDPSYPEAGQYIVLRGRDFIIHETPAYRMKWDGREYFFDWHPYCGPSWLRKDGEIRERQPGEKHPFWDGISAWEAAGKKVGTDGYCILIPAIEGDLP